MGSFQEDECYENKEYKTARQHAVYKVSKLFFLNSTSITGSDVNVLRINVTLATLNYSIPPFSAEVKNGGAILPLPHMPSWLSA
jgi:hypothetical protein